MEFFSEINFQRHKKIQEFNLYLIVANHKILSLDLLFKTILNIFYIKINMCDIKY